MRIPAQSKILTPFPPEIPKIALIPSSWGQGFGPAAGLLPGAIAPHTGSPKLTERTQLPIPRRTKADETNPIPGLRSGGGLPYPVPNPQSLTKRTQFPLRLCASSVSSNLRRSA
jgi:hypothetical protein